LRNNIYSYIGNKNELVCLFSDKPLPFYNLNPIPFTFPVKIRNNIELLNSNVFYYEVELLERHRDSWDSENIVIGYGTISSSLKKYPGSENSSIGFYSTDGTFRNAFDNLKKTRSWSVGDVAGIGIIYLNNSYKAFISLNGILTEIEKTYQMRNPISPIIGLKHSCKIKCNFGEEEFKFDIKSYLHNNIIYSNTNDFLKNIKNPKKYSNRELLLKKLSNEKFIIFNPFTINQNSILMFPNENLISLTQTDNLINQNQTDNIINQTDNIINQNQTNNIITQTQQIDNLINQTQITENEISAIILSFLNNN
jgi:hypothetical protein